MKTHSSNSFQSFFFILFLLGVVFGTTSCDNFGKKVERGNLEVYYLEGVTEAEANKLADYLAEAKWNEGDKKSVQLTKKGDRFVFRLVVKEGYENKEDYIQLFKMISEDMATKLFGGNKVNVEFCDNQFKTLREIEG